MKHFLKRFGLFIFVLSVVSGLLWPEFQTHAQSGTQHGILETWTAPNPVGGSGTVSGYKVYWATGANCTPTSCTWNEAPAQPVVGATQFLIPSSTFPGVNQSYSICVSTLDTSSPPEESVCSAANTVVVGASWPASPNPPTASAGVIK